MEIKADYVVINISTQQRKLLKREDLKPFLLEFDITEGRAKIRRENFSRCIQDLRDAQAMLGTQAQKVGNPTGTIGRVISNLEDAIKSHDLTYPDQPERSPST